MLQTGWVGRWTRELLLTSIETAMKPAEEAFLSDSEGSVGGYHSRCHMPRISRAYCPRGFPPPVVVRTSGRPPARKQSADSMHKTILHKHPFILLSQPSIFPFNFFDCGPRPATSQGPVAALHIYLVDPSSYPSICTSDLIANHRLAAIHLRSQEHATFLNGHHRALLKVWCFLPIQILILL